MSWRNKAVSLGTIPTLLVAGCVLLNGRLAISAQESQQNTEPAAKSAAPVEAPLTEEELIKLIKHNKHDLQKVANEVQARGVDFEFTPDIEKQLTKAGSKDDEANLERLITYTKRYTPSARAARKANASGPQVSAEEAQAYNKLKEEKDPDAIIKDSDAFTQQFPKSSLLTYVYAIEATGYQQKNDASNVLKYSEKSLNLDSKNLMSLLLVSSVMPLPQMLSNISDAEKDKRLVTATNYAQQALQEIDQLPKQPKESAAAYQKRKDQISAGVYASLGMVHLERATMALVGPDMGQLEKAEQSYKMAIAKSETPSPVDYYRLGEAYAGEKKLDDAISAFSKAGQLGQGSIIEKLAAQEVEKLKQAQASQPKAAAKP
jgi:tetratricopeptide (TPR) repeat protein